MRNWKDSMAILHTAVSMSAAFMTAVLPHSVFAQEAKLEYHGAGWIEMGRVEHSYSHSFPPNNFNDYAKDWMQKSGGVVTAVSSIDENWEGGLGLGAVQVHLIRGTKGNGNWYPFVVPFVSEARVTYSHSLFAQGDKLRLTFGNFPYDYNPDVKDLGLYLMSGYVYPGTLVSGFGNVSGAMASYQIGGLRNDLILKSETDDKPLYDFSLADVIGYQVFPGLEAGAGVNFYRLLQQNSKLTSPGKDCVPSSDFGPPMASYNPDSVCFIVEKKDSAGIPVPVDTVTGSYAGIKVMGRFHLDPKAWFGMGPFGKEDFVLYGEAAVLGLKDYPVFYDNILRRIPVMVGFNVPAFGVLDNLSLEIEYYASKNSSDNLFPSYGSWLPTVEGPDLIKYHARDDWKWSVYAAKVLWGHMKFSTQVANDHLRLGGSHDVVSGAEALNTPKDWYWTCKLAYFF